QVPDARALPAPVQNSRASERAAPSCTGCSSAIDAISSIAGAVLDDRVLILDHAPQDEVLQRQRGGGIELAELQAVALQLLVAADGPERLEQAHGAIGLDVVVALVDPDPHREGEAHPAAIGDE